jgi:hypothetical protein
LQVLHLRELERLGVDEEREGEQEDAVADRATDRVQHCVVWLPFH